MRPAVVGAARHARVRAGIDPVALQAVAVGGGHHPAGRLEAAVVVGEVDVAGGRVDVLAAGHVAVGRGVGPPAGLGLGDQRGECEQTAPPEPIALQAVVTEGVIHEPPLVGNDRTVGGLLVIRHGSVRRLIPPKGVRGRLLFCRSRGRFLERGRTALGGVDGPVGRDGARGSGRRNLENKAGTPRRVTPSGHAIEGRPPLSLLVRTRCDRTADARPRHRNTFLSNDIRSRTRGRRDIGAGRVRFYVGPGDARYQQSRRKRRGKRQTSPFQNHSIHLTTIRPAYVPAFHLGRKSIDKIKMTSFVYLKQDRSERPIDNTIVVHKNR